MRLINTSTLEFAWFPKTPPPYAILSHTWGPDEVTFADFTNLSTRATRSGFTKIKQTCEKALKDGFSYAWIDTCCINKESSSELSEAINSMFRWYRDAAICYAYLEDASERYIRLPIRNSSVIEHCRWFTRGWTLQELLAPKEIVFFGAKWTPVGRKTELKKILEQITGIPCAILIGSMQLDQTSVANRMNWAAKRETTREEDIAYCLMGIFDVNMPMIYGEGRNAFIRLQEEILKQTEDDSLFAWRASEESASEAPYRGLFASSPKEFASEATITPFFTSMAGASALLGNGRISLSCALYQDGFIGLKCFQGTELSTVVGFQAISTGSNHFVRSNPSQLVLKPHQYPIAFQTVVFDKFVEMREPRSLSDIYQHNELTLALPPEISLVAVDPKEYTGFQKTMRLPITHLIGKKVAFHMEVSRQASGADVFQEIGRSDKGTSVLLVLWVEQRSIRSFTFYFDLLAVNAGDAESKFIDAERPPEALDTKEAAIAWSTICATGSRTRVGGHQTFSLQLSMSTNADIKNKAEDVRKERERAERERERKWEWEWELTRRLGREMAKQARERAERESERAERERERLQREKRRERLRERESSRER
ncbi:heterokaryon incompatibility domain-containing protein [Trichoderma sp. SZMC 28013]